MTSRRQMLILALLAMLAQQWLVVPSEMQLDMALAPSVHVDHQHAHNDGAMPMDQQMDCCNDQPECQCNPGACMIHPVLEPGRPLAFGFLAHAEYWPTPGFSVPTRASSPYRPPIV